MGADGTPGNPGILEARAAQLANQEAEEQLARKRSRALAPYLVSAPSRGIIGASKYADRLRRQIVEAARDPRRRAVLVFGEPGLEKSNVAALIHFGGPCRTTPMVALDCSRLDWAGAELFGRGDRAGLVENLGEGTLLLQNVNKLPPGLIPKIARLCAEGMYRRASPASTAAATLAAATGATASMDASGAASADPAAPAGPQEPPPEVLQPLRRARCRVIMTASRQIPQLDKAVVTVKVPPLRLRPGDVKELQRYYLREALRRAPGGSPLASPRLDLTPAALKQLESYAWPGNITELAMVVERALLQSGEVAAEGGRLNEEVFWFAKQGKDRFRLNLFAAYPPLKDFLSRRLWPDAINFRFTVFVYPIIVAMLMWGPQDRLHNPALAVFWDCWWPLVFVSFPLLGRVWCAVCPFMICGELAQRLRTALGPLLGPGEGARLLKWPREAAERYGPPFLFGLFAAILVWEEVWDLPDHAALSGWLLLIITAGAVVCSSIFERRFWCRYLCPIGGMTGLMAKLAATEVRARQGWCSGECSTYACYRGEPAQPGSTTTSSAPAPAGSGLAGALRALQDLLPPVGGAAHASSSPGCPLYSHPAQLADNRNCTACMECLRACPNNSVEFRLRLPGSDVWSGHTTSAGEVALMMMLLGAVYLHHLPDMTRQLGANPVALGLTSVTPQHIAASAVVLAAPGALAWAADAVTRSGAAADAVGGLAAKLAARVTGGSAAATSAASAAEPQSAPPAPAPAPFLTLSYAYLPLVWAATLSHYLRPLLSEAGQLLPISAAMVGWEDAPLPVAAADPAVISFLQGSLLLFGAAASAALSRKLAAAPWASFAPQCAAIGLLTAELWTLILPP